MRRFRSALALALVVAWSGASVAVARADASSRRTTVAASRAEATRKGDPHAAVDEAVPKKVVYVCDRNADLVVTYVVGEPGAARVQRQGETWQLPQVPSGSGAKYSDGTVTFWSKGKDGMFEAPGITVNCSER